LQTLSFAEMCENTFFFCFLGSLTIDYRKIFLIIFIKCIDILRGFDIIRVQRKKERIENGKD